MDNFAGRHLKCQTFGFAPLKMSEILNYSVSTKCLVERLTVIRISTVFAMPSSKDRLHLRSGWRGTSLSGLLTVKGTGMREQGSLKGEGIGEICA